MLLFIYLHIYCDQSALSELRDLYNYLVAQISPQNKNVYVSMLGVNTCS